MKSRSVTPFSVILRTHALLVSRVRVLILTIPRHVGGAGGRVSLIPRQHVGLGLGC